MTARRRFSPYQQTGPPVVPFNIEGDEAEPIGAGISACPYFPHQATNSLNSQIMAMTFCTVKKLARTSTTGTLVEIMCMTDCATRE